MHSLLQARFDDLTIQKRKLLRLPKVERHGKLKTIDKSLSTIKKWNKQLK